MKKLLMSIAAGMLLVPGLAMAKDTTFTGEIMDSACAEGGGHESMLKKMGTNDPKACTEACLKGGSKYVLFKADKTFYQLDDQKKPRLIRRAESRGEWDLGQGLQDHPRYGDQSGLVSPSERAERFVRPLFRVSDCFLAGA
jgi:hypothetical protein